MKKNNNSVNDVNITKAFREYKDIISYVNENGLMSYKTFISKWNKTIGLNIRVARMIYLTDEIERQVKVA